MKADHHVLSCSYIGDQFVLPLVLPRESAEHQRKTGRPQGLQHANVHTRATLVRAHDPTAPETLGSATVRSTRARQASVSIRELRVAVAAHN